MNTCSSAKEALQQEQSGIIDATMDGDEKTQTADVLTDEAICAAFIAEHNYFFSHAALAVLRRSGYGNHILRIEEALDIRSTLLTSGLCTAGEGQVCLDFHTFTATPIPFIKKPGGS